MSFEEEAIVPVEQTDFQKFIEKKSLRYSQRTIDEYTRYHNQIKNKEININVLSHFLNNNPNNVARSFLKLFIRFHKRRGKNIEMDDLIPLNIEEELEEERPRGRAYKPLIKFWTAEQIYELVKRVELKDKALIMILFETGLRASETKALRLENIDF